MNDTPGRLAADEAVRHIMGLVAPSPISSPFAAPGQFPAVCRFCGDAAFVHILLVDDRVRVGVEHDTPLCPEFARALEEQP